MFRKNIKEGTELGRSAQKFMDDGNLVPDEIVIGMVEAKLQEGLDTNGYIFDGFPRTVAQAESLDTLLEKYSQPITLMLALDVPHEELRKRILERGKSSGRTDDQDEEKINTRIQVYEQETLPVANYYQSQGKFHKVYGVGSIEKIFDRISNAISMHTT